jgi:hypothetical protein
MQVTVPVVTKPGLPANQAFKDQCFETIKSTGAKTIKHLIDESINERRKPNSGRPYGVKTRKDGNGNNGGGDDNSGGNGGNGNNGNNDDDFDNNNRKNLNHVEVNGVTITEMVQKFRRGADLNQLVMVLPM